MIDTLTTRATAPSTPSVGDWRRWPGAVANWLMARDHAYREARKLAQISDETLRDIGLTRAEFEDMLRKG